MLTINLSGSNITGDALYNLIVKEQKLKEIVLKDCIAITAKSLALVINALPSDTVLDDINESDIERLKLAIQDKSTPFWIKLTLSAKFKSLDFGWLSACSKDAGFLYGISAFGYKTMLDGRLDGYIALIKLYPMIKPEFLEIIIEELAPSVIQPEAQYAFYKIIEALNQGDKLKKLIASNQKINQPLDKKEVLKQFVPLYWKYQHQDPNAKMSAKETAEKLYRNAVQLDIHNIARNCDSLGAVLNSAYREIGLPVMRMG